MDDLKDKLLKAGVEVRMSKDNVKLVPMLNFDLAEIERILWVYFTVILSKKY